jgi:hypothetical protein
VNNLTDAYNYMQLHASKDKLQPGCNLTEAYRIALPKPKFESGSNVRSKLRSVRNLATETNYRQSIIWSSACHIALPRSKLDSVSNLATETNYHQVVI